MSELPEELRLTTDEVDRMLTKVSGDASWGARSTEEKRRHLTFLINEAFSQRLGDSMREVFTVCDHGDSPCADTHWNANVTLSPPSTHRALLVCVREVKEGEREDG